MGAYSGSLGARRAGMRVMEIGFILLIAFGAFFEMLFSAGRPHSLGALVFPAALILLGVYLVLVRSGLLRRGGQEESNPPQDTGQGGGSHA